MEQSHPKFTMGIICIYALDIDRSSTINQLTMQSLPRNQDLKEDKSTLRAASSMLDADYLMRPSPRFKDARSERRERG